MILEGKRAEKNNLRQMKSSRHTRRQEVVLYPLKGSSPYGKRGWCRSPVVSGNPNIMLRFCNACPEAPFTRLSICNTHAQKDKYILFINTKRL